MSDTDDTDLLLLIPPDFFLVHTPDSDSDCDISFSFDHNEVKDSIVSNLITQVNDLESRICMIEHLDRSATCCSSHIEESFITQQSINSLTESDILRSQIESNKKNLAYISNSNHMLESIGTTNDDSKLLIERHLADANAINYNLRINNANKQSCSIADIECTNKITCNDIENQGLIDFETVKAQCHNNDKEELLNEIDCYLEAKSKQLVNSRQIGLNESTKVHTQPDFSNESINSPKLTLELDNHKLHAKGSTQNKSLALPEVFELLKEMEETQHEIGKKLKYGDSISQPDQGKFSVSELSKTEHFTTNRVGLPVVSSQIEGIEEFNSSRPTTHMLLNKQTDNSNERLKSVSGKYQIQENYRSMLDNSSNKQVGSLFKPNIYDESFLKTDNKTIIRRSCEAAMTNLTPKNGRSPLSHVDNSKELSDNPSAKRHLNFEETGISQNQSKPRSIPYIDELKNNILENHKKNGKMSFKFPSSSNSRLSINLDGKQEHVSTQRNPVNEGNLKDILNPENNPSRSTILQNKISSSNLLSLSELWNKEPSFHSEDPNKLRQKLEEEKYRRQHCEQQIQALQVRVLEEQERLAVAVQVDQEKDKAILQITESWRKLNNHWNELEEQRHSLAQELQKEKESSKVKTDELMKKVERWEKEVSQALDLAAGYKEKSEAVQKQMDSVKKNTDEKLDQANSQLLQLSKENEKILEENNYLLEELNGYKNRINEEEKLLSRLKVELEKFKKKCSDYEAEINVIKEQKESLTNKIKDEKGRNGILEQQKTALQQSLSEATKREKAAQDEARVSNERIEVARTELRALYQGQLETVVKEKLQEFQCQLEAAEAALKAELQSKEKQWMEKANDQCRQLHERHKLELCQKEESCRVEINKWKTRLMESEKLRSASENKLQEETNKRAEIAHRLHSVMETQWREALNIISNPLQNAYQATKEDDGNKWSSNPHTERLKHSGDVKASQSNSSTSVSQVDDTPFCREGLVTSRTAEPQQEQQLKKYIQMLLERGPGNPVLPSDSLQESLDQSFCQESTMINRFMLDNTKKSAGLERFGYGSKPPWK